MTAPIVFAGPTLSAVEVHAVLPQARVEPPLGRGDLARLLDRGERSFLVIDGVFAHRLAAAPSEFVTALDAGAAIAGAASLGAVRAVECRPAGMRGIGAVYRLFRLGILRDDDEVAVAADPARDHRAVSVALVHVRYLLLAGLRAGHLDRACAAAVLAAARDTHFADRRWESIFAAAGVLLTTELRGLIAAADVKRRDALRALTMRWGEGRVRVRKVRPERYPGHDPLLGRSRDQWRQELGARHWDELERDGRLESELMRRYARTLE
jgi:hypothetical protein